MELIVDLSAREVSMRGETDLQRFAVVAVPGPEGGSGHGPSDGPAGETGRDAALAATLARADAGRLDPSGDVLVPVDAVRRLATESATAQGTVLDTGWESGLADMVAYAATRGWIADDGSIRAHVEWEA
jgi:hypothetical protein